MMESIPSERQQTLNAAAAAPRPGLDMTDREPVDVLEEYHRYLYASRFTKNRRVVDVACGSGYGPALVSLNAESVLAVGADGERVAAAAHKYAEFPNLRFELGRYNELRLHQRSADIALCFDLLGTLATEARGKVMEAVKEALVPGGMLLVSVPIRSADAESETEPTGAQLPAYSGVELFEFLKNHFQHVRFIGQKPLTLSAMWSLHQWQDDLFRFHMRDDLFTLPRSVEMFAEPGHIIALCSEEAVSAEITNNSKSVYFDSAQAGRNTRLVDELDAVRQDLTHARTYATQAVDERDTFRDAIAVLTNENLGYINKLDELQREAESQAARAAALEASLATAAAEIEELRRLQAEQTSWAELLTEEHAVAQSRNQELESAIARKSADLEELQRVHNEQSVWSEKLSEDHAVLQQRVQDLERRLEEASLHAATSGEENVGLQERVQLLHRKTEEVTAQLAEATLTLETLRPRLAEAEHRYQRMLESSSESAAATEFLTAQVKELQSALDEKIRSDAEARAALAGREETIRALEESAVRGAHDEKAFEEERAGLQTRIAELESHETAEAGHAAALTQENQKLRARLYELQKQFDDRSSAARNAGQENEKLNARVAALQKSLEEKVALVGVTNQDLAGVKERLQATQADYENKLQQARQWEVTNKKRIEQYNDVQRKCDEQALMLRQMKVDAEKQAAAFETFQMSQADVQQRYNRSQIRVQELQQQVAILEQKLEQYGKSGIVKTLSRLGLLSGGDS